MQNEKPLLINCNYSENTGNEISFYKTLKSVKRNEKLKNESSTSLLRRRQLTHGIMKNLIAEITKVPFEKGRVMS
jgi:hypothetical protein